MRRSARLITILLAIDLTDIARYGEGLDSFTTIPEPRQHGTPLTSRYCDSQSRVLTWRDCGMLFKRTNDYFRSALKLRVHIMGEAAVVSPEIGNFGKYDVPIPFVWCGGGAELCFRLVERSMPLPHGAFIFSVCSLFAVTAAAVAPLARLCRTAAAWPIRNDTPLERDRFGRARSRCWADK